MNLTDSFATQFRRPKSENANNARNTNNAYNAWPAPLKMSVGGRGADPLTESMLLTSSNSCSRNGDSSFRVTTPSTSGMGIRVEVESRNPTHSTIVSANTSGSASGSASCEQAAERTEEAVEAARAVGAASLLDIICHEFLVFCRNTTIRGVPRIVKSPSRHLRIFWCCWFWMLFVGLTVCSAVLILQYLTHDVIHPPRVLHNQHVPFPSVTVCNLRPLSTRAERVLRRHRVRNPREYALALHKYAFSMFYWRRRARATYRRITGALSLGGYLESLWAARPDLFDQIGHNQSDLIINCRVTYLHNNKPTSSSCQKTGRWTRFLHAQYMNCYTYSLANRFVNKTNTIQLFLYLNENQTAVHCIDCFTSDVKSQLSGGVLVIHKHQSVPDIDTNVINLQPGTLTEVRLKIIQNMFNEPPFGRCSHRTPHWIHLAVAEGGTGGGDDVEGVAINHTTRHTRHSNSEFACMQFETQRSLNTQCACNAIEYPLVKRALPFCASADHFLFSDRCRFPSGASSSRKSTRKRMSGDSAGNSSTAANRTRDAEEDAARTPGLDPSCAQQLYRMDRNIRCKIDVLRMFSANHTAASACRPLCTFFAYESDRSISSWPTRSWQRKWISTKFAKTIHRKPELRPYRLANRLYEAGRYADVQRTLSNVSVLENKLVALMIIRPNYNVHMVEEKAVFSLTSLLSQLGGLLSIWIGLSIISIVEILEMIINCFEVYKRRRSTPWQPKRQQKFEENIFRNRRDDDSDGNHFPPFYNPQNNFERQQTSSSLSINQSQRMFSQYFNHCCLKIV